LEAIALLLTKFSEELIAAQLAAVSATLALALYWLLIRKKKKESAEWVPAALVRAYMDRMRSDERETRIRLFGDDFSALPPLTLTAGLSSPTAVAGADPQLGRELEAMRTQLALADQRAIEFDRNLNALKLEKGALEQKLKEAQSATPAAPVSADQGAMLKELEDYKAKLKEYEVIEDDLANLKKFQKENADLKQRVSQLEAGGSQNTTISGTPAAPAADTKVSGVTDHINTPVTVISGGKSNAAPLAAVPAASAAPAAVAATSAEANTNVLQTVMPTVSGNPSPVVAAPEEKSSQKKEEELLSEFEKMLAS
jgi:hypothetical protein